MTLLSVERLSGAYVGWISGGVVRLQVGCAAADGGVADVDLEKVAEEGGVALEEADGLVAEVGVAVHQEKLGHECWKTLDAAVRVLVGGEIVGVDCACEGRGLAESEGQTFAGDGVDGA